MHADDEGLFLFVLDLIFTVDSLKFLRDAPDFWRLYGITVIQRLSYVCRSWNGLIARHQLKHSDFLTVVEDLAAGGDVNDDHKFFSYEHFYVIYCKFFELDVTKRNALSLAELSRYAEDSGINERVFARVYLLRRYQDTASFDYRDFVWFILSEEDKTQPMSIEFWFHVLDQDGDGLISMFDLESFYAETCKLLTRENIEAVTFNDKLTEILDRLGAAIKVGCELLTGSNHFAHSDGSNRIAPRHHIRSVAKESRSGPTDFGYVHQHGQVLHVRCRTE